MKDFCFFSNLVLLVLFLTLVEETVADEPVCDWCYNNWSNWSPCSRSCGVGSRTRSRTRKQCSDNEWRVVSGHGAICSPSGSSTCNRHCLNGGRVTYFFATNTEKCTCPPGWTGTCCESRVHCNQYPERIANGNYRLPTIASMVPIVYGTTASYYCDEGYNIHSFRRDNVTTVTCDKDGKWSTNFAECRKVTCQEPVDPANGYVRTNDGLDYSSSANYGCYLGFQLSGLQARTCTSSGSWSGNPPICNPVKCIFPISPSNGRVQLTEGDDYEYRSEIVFSCNQDYVLSGAGYQGRYSGGKKYLSCNRNGKWASSDSSSSSVNADFPSCNQVTTTPPYNSATGLITPGLKVVQSILMIVSDNITRMARELPIYTADAFTAVPFQGNPAAVCLVAEPKNLSDEQRQAIGTEMNLSETAFVEPLEGGDSFEKSAAFSLRWFTPTCESGLCGHATLASAAVLNKVIGNQNAELSFKTRESGILKTVKEGERIIMDFPQSTTEAVNKEGIAELLKTLGCGELIEEVRHSPEMDDLMVVLKPMQRSSFENLGPNISQMTASGKYRGVILTCKAVDSKDDKGNAHDYLARFFAPWVGINEDPVTGSSYTVTGPYWAKVLGKTSLYARQASKRGGNIFVQMQTDSRIKISGEAVVTLKGSFLI